MGQMMMVVKMETEMAYQMAFAMVPLMAWKLLKMVKAVKMMTVETTETEMAFEMACQKAFVMARELLNCLRVDITTQQ